MLFAKSMPSVVTFIAGPSHFSLMVEFTILARSLRPFGVRHPFHYVRLFVPMVFCLSHDYRQLDAVNVAN
jgi:hypothetical protein